MKTDLIMLSDDEVFFIGAKLRSYPRPTASSVIRLRFLVSKEMARFNNFGHSTLRIHDIDNDGTLSIKVGNRVRMVKRLIERR